MLDVRNNKVRLFIPEMVKDAFNGKVVGFGCPGGKEDFILLGVDCRSYFGAGLADRVLRADTKGMGTSWIAKIVLKIR